MAHLRLWIGVTTFLYLLLACHSIRVSTVQAQQGALTTDAADADSETRGIGETGLHKNRHKTHVMWCGFGNNKTMDIIRKNKDSITHISVIAYMVDITGFFTCSCDPTLPWQQPCNHNTSLECPWWDHHIEELHRHGILVNPTITLPPGYDDTGLQIMMTDEVLQQLMIERAVEMAVKKRYVGYNIDWEPAGSSFTITSQQMAVFLKKFRARLNAHKKTLSWDGWSGLWEPQTISPGVDLMMDMSTYGDDGANLENAVLQNVVTAGGMNRYGMGVLPGQESEAELENIFQVAQNISVRNIYSWPDEKYYQLPPSFWTIAKKWLYTYP